MGPPLQHNECPIATRRKGCFGRELIINNLRNRPKIRKFSACWLVGDQETILAPVRVIKDTHAVRLSEAMGRFCFRLEVQALCRYLRDELPQR